MSARAPDYEAEFVAAIRRNLEKVLADLEAGNRGLKKKIATFSSRFDFLEAEIEQKMRDDPMFRAWFAKDPGKQKLHENAAAAFIQDLPGVEDFIQRGHNELQLIGGAVVPRKEIRAQGASTRAKSIDFTWRVGPIEYCASHKYTKEGGGGQDSQYEDLKAFIREANDSSKPDRIFLAIADGAYYSRTDSETHTTKLERLKGLANRRTVFALRIDDIEAFMKEISLKA